MTKIRQSKELIAFYNAYNEWLEANAPKENKYDFTRFQGLCGSMITYCVHDDINIISRTIKFEQDNLFKKANLDILYPFGRMAFIKDYEYDTQHLDPNRIAWVKAHLTEQVDEEFTLQ